MNSARHKLMLGLALVIAVLVLVGWMVHRRPARAVAQYQRQLLAAGEKLKVEDLLPQPAPLESNGAPLFNLTFRSSILGTNVLEKNPPLAMHMVAPSRAAVGWAQPDVRSERTNTWSEVEAALDEYNDTLDLIREAAQKPFFDFCLNYLQGPSLPLPHLAPLKRAVQQLTIATLCDLHDGHVAAATTNLESMLSLVKGTADERLGISQLVRLAMAHISLAATWELLQSTNLTDGQLAAIQHDWAEVEFVQSAENAMALERALGEMTLEQMRNSSAEFRQILSLGGGVPVRFGLSFDQTVNKIVSELAVGTKEARWRW